MPQINRQKILSIKLDIVDYGFLQYCMGGKEVFSNEDDLEADRLLEKILENINELYNDGYEFGYECGYESGDLGL